MPRYFFHISHTGRRAEDFEGTVLDNLESATRDAALSLRHLIAAALISGKPSSLEAILVADEEGSILATVGVTEAMEPIINLKRSGSFD